MREDIKRWIEALRSGEYEQTDGVMKKPESGGFSYCCGGVYAEICSQPISHAYKLKDSFEGEDNWGEENPDVYEWWEAKVGFGMHDYIEMNDNGSTFEEIADQIEEDYNNGLIKNDVHA